MARMRRQGVFQDDDRDKADGGLRVQALLTPSDSERFESTRLRLQQLLQKRAEGRHPVRRPSDADTVAYLLRGEAASVAYLKRQK